MQVKARSKRIEDLREYLHAELLRLRHEITSIATEGQESTGYGNHMADDGSASFEQAKSVALRSGLEGRLFDVQSALNRMENGTYGFCQLCGQHVDPARLKAIPSAGLCYKCQSHVDSRA